MLDSNRGEYHEIINIFIVYTDSYSLSWQGVIVGGCKIDQLTVVSTSVLLASFQQGLQNALDQYATSCAQAKMKSPLRMRDYASSGTNVLPVNDKELENVDKATWGCIH